MQVIGKFNLIEMLNNKNQLKKMIIILIKFNLVK
jgi:hypothetical protein